MSKGGHIFGDSTHGYIGGIPLNAKNSICFAVSYNQGGIAPAARKSPRAAEAKTVASVFE